MARGDSQGLRLLAAQRVTPAGAWTYRAPKITPRVMAPNAE